MTRTAPRGGINLEINLRHECALELYHNALSMCSGQVRTCLAEKHLTIAGKHIHLIETGWYENLSPEFKHINPGCTVPVLVHNGHPVYESYDQIKYIDAHFHGPSLRPDALKDQVEFWHDNCSLKGDIFDPENQRKRMGACIVGLTLPIFASMIQDIGISKILWGLLHHPSKERPVLFLLMKALGARIWLLPPLRKLMVGSRDCMRVHLQKLEGSLADNRVFLTGDDFTLGDVAMMSLFERMRMGNWQFLWEDLPNVSKYWDRIQQRNSYKVAFIDVRLPIMARAEERFQNWTNTKAYFADPMTQGY